MLFKEALLHFKGKKVIRADGYAKIDMDRLYGQKITDIRTWGKHLLICFKDFTVQIHFLLFGSFRIDETKKINPKLHLHFAGTDLYFYMTSVHLLEGRPADHYDFRSDLLGESWDAKVAAEQLKASPDTLLCDILLDQQVFAGSGNIVKNEALFRAKLHPLNKTGDVPAAKRTALVKAVHGFTRDFLKWKRSNQLDAHLQVYEQQECPRCHIPLHKKTLGKTKRPTYYCNNCQVNHSA